MNGDDEAAEPRNPFGLLIGLRCEPRGEFPQHDDTPRPVLSGPDAKARAARRLAEWKAAQGGY